eukprot:scaffold1565_cov221-Amphora_coffeaeformis.AAC.15
MPRHIREPTIHFFWLLMDAASNTRTGSRPYYHIVRYSHRMVGVVDSRLADRPRERETRQKKQAHQRTSILHLQEEEEERERENKKKKHFTRRTQQQTLLQ